VGGKKATFPIAESIFFALSVIVDFRLENSVVFSKLTETTVLEKELQFVIQGVLSFSELIFAKLNCLLIEKSPHFSLNSELDFGALKGSNFESKKVPSFLIFNRRSNFSD
jgi:hypothetical protein